MMHLAWSWMWNSHKCSWQNMNDNITVSKYSSIRKSKKKPCYYVQSSEITNFYSTYKMNLNWSVCEKVSKWLWQKMICNKSLSMYFSIRKSKKNLLLWATLRNNRFLINIIWGILLDRECENAHKCSWFVTNTINVLLYQKIKKTLCHYEQLVEWVYQAAYWRHN